MVLALAFWLGVAVAMGVGWWWRRRAPANPTGLLLFVAGARHGLRLACFCWATRVDSRCRSGSWISRS